MEDEWWLVNGGYLASSAGHSGMVTSASNDVVSNPMPDRKLGGWVRTDRNGLLGRLRKLYIWRDRMLEAETM